MELSPDKKKEFIDYIDSRLNYILGESGIEKVAVSAEEGKGIFNAIRRGGRWAIRKITGKKGPNIPRGGAKPVTDLAAEANPYITGGAREEGGVAKFYKRVAHDLHTQEGRYAEAQDIARRETDLSKIKIKPNSTGGVDITGVKPGGSPYFNSVPNPDAPKGVRSVVNGIVRPVHQAVALPFTAPVSAVSNGLRIGADAIGWKSGARALRRFRNNVRRIGDGPSTGNVGWDKLLSGVGKGVLPIGTMLGLYYYGDKHDDPLATRIANIYGGASFPIWTAGEAAYYGNIGGVRDKVQQARQNLPILAADMTASIANSAINSGSDNSDPNSFGGRYKRQLVRNLAPTFAELVSSPFNEMGQWAGRQWWIPNALINSYAIPFFRERVEKGYLDKLEEMSPGVTTTDTKQKVHDVIQTAIRTVGSRPNYQRKQNVTGVTDGTTYNDNGYIDTDNR